MNKTVIVVSGIFVIATLIGFYIWSINNRFIVVSDPKGAGYEIDKSTGQSWFLAGPNKYLQKDPSVEATVTMIEKESAEDEAKYELASAKRLPDEELKKVTGDANEIGYGYFSGKIYNGSSWNIKKIIFTVAAKSKNKPNLLNNILWKRDVATNVSIDSLKTSTFSETITGDQGTALAGWLIKEAYGEKLIDTSTSN